MIGTDIVYVGVGGASRPFQLRGRNRLWNDVMKGKQFTVEIVKWFKSRKSALTHETKLIKKLSPKANIKNNKPAFRSPAKLKADYSGYITQSDGSVNLTDYLIDGTQQEVADALEITQGAVYQMVANNRDVRLILNNKGKIVRASELKTFPTGKHGTRK